MSTMLLVAILCFLIGMVVMIVYLIDRVNSMERKHALAVSTAFAGVDSAAPAFGNIDGAHLWEVLSGMAPLDSTAVTIDEIRLRYEPVLRRHIEELFEDGVLDGRHGVRFQPKAERVIKCSAGMLNSWIPPADARAVYDIGLERARITSMDLKLEAVCDRLYAAVGINPDRTVPGLLLPAQTIPSFAELEALSAATAANEALPANPEMLSLPQPVAPEILEPAVTEEKQTVAASAGS
jgi:hypothetical protein